jgi:hypothetical protein
VVKFLLFNPKESCKEGTKITKQKNLVDFAVNFLFNHKAQQRRLKNHKVKNLAPFVKKLSGLCG